MNNKYSLTILGFMIGFFFLGISMLYYQTLIGFIPLLLAGLLGFGFKKLNPSPLEVGIITFLGEKRPVLVKGLTLVLDWLPIEIVGVIPVISTKRNHDFKEGIVARCYDGSTITGKVSITLAPNTSNGEKMILFDDNGQMEGVIKQLDGLVVSHIKEMAAQKDMSYVKMISDFKNIAQSLENRLNGKDSQGLSALGNVEEMGVEIINLSVDLVASEKVKATDEDKVIESLQRDAELQDVVTFKKQIDELIKGFVEDNEARRLRGEPTIPIPTYKEVVAMIDDQRTLKEGRRQVIQAGRLVTFTGNPSR